MLWTLAQAAADDKGRVHGWARIVEILEARSGALASGE